MSTFLNLDVWAFGAMSATNRLTNASWGFTGSATYRGPAAGRYAVYEPVAGIPR